MNNITINKECIDNYKKYEEIKSKLYSLRHSIESLNRKYDGSDSIISHMEYQQSFMASLFRNHSDVINTALYKEVERLKQELDKYNIE